MIHPFFCVFMTRDKPETIRHDINLYHLMNKNIDMLFNIGRMLTNIKKEIEFIMFKIDEIEKELKKNKRKKSKVEKILEEMKKSERLVYIPKKVGRPPKSN